MREPARSEYSPLADHADHRRDQLRRVLVVGVHHHHDVGAVVERELVAGLLVAAVAAVLRMHVHDHAVEPARQLHGVVLAGIVDDDHQVDHVVGHDLAPGFLEGVLGVVGRHHHDDLGLFEHPLRPL